MFETILIQLGAFSVNVSISAAQFFLSLLIIFSAVKLYKTRDLSVLTSWHAKFFMLMIITELVSAFAGTNIQKSLSEVPSIWTYMYLYVCLILFNGANLNRVLYAFFAASILNAFSGAYDVFVTNFDRAIGFYTHALTYGNVAAVVFICALGLLVFVKYQPPKLRMLIAAAAVMSAFALFLSASRGPMLYAAITAAVMFVYQYKFKAAAVVTGIAVFLAALIYFDAPLRERIFTDRGGPSTESSMGTRVVLWKTAIKGISERPLLGFGKGNFTKYVKDNVTVPLSSTAHAHNSYLHYTFNNGLVGLVFLLGFLVSLFRYIYRRSKEYPPAKAALFVFIVFLLEGLTENNFGDSEVVMLTMLLSAVLTAPVTFYKNL